jgi:hypothetical protein
MALAVSIMAPAAHAQSLVFGNHRDVAIPDYATVRIGPFYSTIAFSLSVGYRYSDSYGSGTDYLQSNERGAILKDGSDLPILAALDFRNYLLITRHMDLDMSVRFTYEYYPLRTQVDSFDVDLVEEGVFGTFSSEFRITPYLLGNVYDTLVYRTDFVDTRGREDAYGGQEYRYFRNRVGMNLTWLMAEDKQMKADVAREDNIPFADEFAGQEYVLYDESVAYRQNVLPGLWVGATTRFWQYDYVSPERQDASFQDVRLDLSFDKDYKGGVRLTEATSIDFSLGLCRPHGGRCIPGNVQRVHAGQPLNGIGGRQRSAQNPVVARPPPRAALPA